MQPDSSENIVGFFHSSTDHRRCTQSQCTCHTQIVFFNCLLREFVYFSCMRTHDNPGFEYSSTLFLQKKLDTFLFSELLNLIVIAYQTMRQWPFPICFQTAKNFSARTIFQTFLSSRFFGIFCPATDKHCKLLFWVFSTYYYLSVRTTSFFVKRRW